MNQLKFLFNFNAKSLFILDKLAQKSINNLKMQDQNNNFYSGLRKELLDLEVMKNYNNAIVRKAFRKITKPGKQVLDFGAGIGTLSNIFRERYNLNPFCLEIDKKNISFLREGNLIILRVLIR